MARRRRVHWPPRGIPISFSTPSPTVRCYRSLHLNGYKIANPTLLARITREELEQLLRGYGWTPYFVEGHEPALMHEAMAATLDIVIEQIKQIHYDARVSGKTERPRWPMIVLASPKGWTGPKLVDGRQIEGTFRSHQVPLFRPRNSSRTPQAA